MDSDFLGVFVFSPIVKDRNFTLITLSSLNLITKFKNDQTFKSDLVGYYKL